VDQFAQEIISSIGTPLANAIYVVTVRMECGVESCGMLALDMTVFNQFAVGHWRDLDVVVLH
jgi:hypothetical protein